MIVGVFLLDFVELSEVSTRFILMCVFFLSIFDPVGALGEWHFVFRTKSDDNLKKEKIASLKVCFRCVCFDRVLLFIFWFTLFFMLQNFYVFCCFDFVLLNI